MHFVNVEHAENKLSRRPAVRVRSPPNTVFFFCPSSFSFRHSSSVPAGKKKYVFPSRFSRETFPRAPIIRNLIYRSRTSASLSGKIYLRWRADGYDPDESSPKKRTFRRVEYGFFVDFRFFFESLFIFFSLPDTRTRGGTRVGDNKTDVNIL